MELLFHVSEVIFITLRYQIKCARYSDKKFCGNSSWTLTIIVETSQKLEEKSLNLNNKIDPYRSGAYTVNSKFHFIRSFFEYLARFLSFHV